MWLLAALGGARLSRVFAANMAASLAGYAVPAVGSPVARSWLVARCERLEFASVLASVAVERAVDAAAFLSFAIAAVLLVGCPHAGEWLRTGVGTALAASAALVDFPMVVRFRVCCLNSHENTHDRDQRE